MNIKELKQELVNIPEDTEIQARWVGRDGKNIYFTIEVNYNKGNDITFLDIIRIDE